MTTRQTGVHVQGATALLRTLNRMDRTMTAEIRDEAFTIADTFLALARGAASSEPAARAMAAFRVYRDRFPKVGYAASTSAGVSGGATVSQLWPGHEFGSNALRQFPARNSPTGYFFFPTLRSKGPELAEEWVGAVFDRMSDDWNRGAAEAGWSL